MKKLIITIAILLGLTMTSFAEGGLFNRGNNGKNASSGYSLYFNTRDGESSGVDTPMLPNHGSQENEAAPLGSGIALLTALGAGYVVAKRRRE